MPYIKGEEKSNPDADAMMFRGHDEEYDIISNSDLIILVRIVNERIIDGWRIHGDLLWDGRRYIREITRYTPGLRKWKGGKKAEEVKEWEKAPYERNCYNCECYSDLAYYITPAMRGKGYKLPPVDTCDKCRGK